MGGGGVSDPPDAAEVLLEVVQRLRETEFTFMVVGAFAVMAHGRPRTTADIDVSVNLPFRERDRLRGVLEELGDEVEERTSPQWGKRLVTTHPSGLEIEVFFVSGHPFYRREFDRRVTRTVRGEEVPFISPEDLVLRKLVNHRKRRGEDWADAESVARVQGTDLDLAYLREHCGPQRVCGLVEELADAVEAS